MVANIGGCYMLDGAADYSNMILKAKNRMSRMRGMSGGKEVHQLKRVSRV
jgi:hypothetical protein